MNTILILIVSLNAIDCQFDCTLMKPYNKSHGIHVYHSVVHDKYLMYKNGSEWMFKIKEEGLVMDTYIVKRIDPNIINQFGGHNFDCNVKYQNGSNGRIVTKCTNGFEDNGTQFDAKDVIFRASNDKTNDWFIIYNKNNPNIWCYSFTSSTRLETNATKCEEKMGIKTPFLNSMDPLLKESIEGIFEYEEEDTIVGHRIFFNINAVPKYCTELMNDETTECKSEANLTPVSETCFPTPPTVTPKESSYWPWIITGICIFVSTIIVGCFVHCLWKIRKIRIAITKLHIKTRKIEKRNDNRHRNIAEIEGHLDQFPKGNPRHTLQQWNAINGDLTALTASVSILDAAHNGAKSEMVRLAENYGHKNAELFRQSIDKKTPPDLEEYVEWKCPYCPHEGTIDWKRPIGDERYAPPPAPAPASPHTTETNDPKTTEPKAAPSLAPVQTRPRRRESA